MNRMVERNCGDSVSEGQDAADEGSETSETASYDPPVRGFLRNPASSEYPYGGQQPALELAWAAGFWDGEGSTWFDPSRTGARLGIGQCDVGPLKRFQAAVGGGSITGPYERFDISDGYKRRPRYKWQSSSRSETTRIMRLLRPLVCEPKHEQFDHIFGRDEQLALEESV